MILDIKFDNGETLKVQGVYTIDEEALNKLPASEFQNLREQGYLAFVYAMILSLGHISGMVKARNIRNENAKGQLHCNNWLWRKTVSLMRKRTTTPEFAKMSQGII